MPDEEAQDLRSILSRVATDAEEAEQSTTEAPEPRAPRTARGPDGKFQPKAETVDADAEESSKETETPAGEPSADEGVEAAGKEPEKEAIPVDVPQHWSQADKDLIAALPKEHQAKVVDRYKAIEAGFTPRLQRAAEIERQYQGAMQIFEPHLPGLAQRGQTPSDVIRAWAAIETDLMQGRDLVAQGGINAKGAEHVARIIQAYNIDPGAVAALLRGEALPATNGNQGNGAPPQIALPPALMEKLTTLETRLDSRDQAEQAARQAAVQAQLDAFANEKDENGLAKNPYFSELERDMALFAQIDISQGKTPVIADLYDRAVHANRETRSKVLAANSAEATRKAAAERKAKAEAAARAASSVSGSPGSGGSPAERRGPRSLREEIAEAAADTA
jgi:hypothetical protein